MVLSHLYRPRVARAHTGTWYWHKHNQRWQRGSWASGVVLVRRKGREFVSTY